MAFQDGVLVALPAPLTDDGDLNLDVLPRHIDDCLAAGVSGFWVNGATGCSIYLDVAQRRAMLDAVVAAVAGRASVLAMVGAVAQRDGVELARHARQAGCKGVSSLPPMLYRTNGSLLRDYLRALTDAAGLPMTYYHVPGLTHVALDAEAMATLCKDVPLAGVKYSEDDVFKALEVRMACPDVAFFSGIEETLLGGLALGAFDGAVGAAQNFMPGPIVDLYRAFHAGDLGRAQRVARGVARVAAVQGMFDFTAATYAILNLLSYGYGRPMAPMPYLADADTARCREALKGVVNPGPIDDGRLIRSDDFVE